MNEIEKLAFQICNSHCSDLEETICSKQGRPVIERAIKMRSAYMLLATALQEQAERENPKPLTLEEIENLIEQPIWIDTGEILIAEQIVGYYEILERITEEPVKVFWFTRRVRGLLADDYGKTWLAYKYRPNHIGEANGMEEK